MPSARQLELSQVPEEGKLLESYTSIKMLSPHSTEELLQFTASPITLSLCSRKQERSQLLQQALPVRKVMLWERMGQVSLEAFLTAF